MCVFCCDSYWRFAWYHSRVIHMQRKNTGLIVRQTVNSVHIVNNTVDRIEMWQREQQQKKTKLIRSEWVEEKKISLAKMLGVCDYIKNTIINKLTNGDKSNVPKGETFNWRFSHPYYCYNYYYCGCCCFFLSTVSDIISHHAIRQGHFYPLYLCEFEMCKVLSNKIIIQFIASDVL